MHRQILNPAGPDAEVIPMNRADHTFRRWLRDEHYSPRTLDQYLSYVRRARLAVGPLHRADTATLREWWSTLPASASSRNAARSALIAYYRHAGRANPAEALPCIPPADALPRPVTVEVYDHLFHAARNMGGHHQLLHALLAYTGCRISEAAHARRSHIDLHAARWRIIGKGARRRGPKERTVALHPDLVALVAAWPQPDWLFPATHRPGPIHRSTAGHWWRQLAHHAGITATAHQIRHAVATIGLERSQNIRAVQELLGHADLGTTQRYTLVTVEHLTGLVGHLGPDAA